MITEGNPTPPTTAPRLNFRTTGVGWVERTRCFTDAGEELAPNLNFPANNWRGNPHRCIAAASYPLVFVPAAPDAIPSELLALQDDTPIVTRRETAPYDAIAKAGVIRAEVAGAIERHKHGLYTAREIAHLSYKSASASSLMYRGDSESEYQEIASAFKSGRLIAFKGTGKILRDSEIRQFPGVLSQSSAALNAMNDCWFKLDDVNAWLESERATWRLSPSPSASAPVVTGPEPVAAPAEAVPAVVILEPVADRDARRLREFEGLGGAVQIARGGRATLVGRQGALQELADRERAAGRQRSDRSDIGKALRAEAERQHRARPG